MNGGPSCWDRQGGIKRCPSYPCGWQYRFGEEIDAAVGKDAKIAVVVAEHLAELRKSSPNFQKCLIVISDETDLQAEGVLVVEFNENGGDVHQERVALADLVEVLLRKVTSG